eukprot:gene4935-5177_t
MGLPVCPASDLHYPHVLIPINQLCGSSGVNFTLEGIAIRGCTAPVSPVLVTSSASLHLANVQFVNNSNTGALAADALTAGSGNGGGVQCFGCQQLLFERVYADSNNASGSGGVIHIQNSPGGLIVRDSEFVRNVATISGGTIRAVDADIAVEGTLFDRSHGGGGFLSFKVTAKQLPKLVMIDGVIEGNRALYAGGALNVFGGIATLTNCTMHSNEVTEGGYGGAISHEGPGSLSLVNCALMNNSADFGGAVYATRADSNVMATNTSLVSNKAGRFGGGIFCNNVACTLLGCSLINNTAVAAGGGIYAQAAASLHVNNCAVLGNEAQRSAGMHVSSVFDVHIAQSKFEANQAQQDAGAAFLSQCPAVRISSSTFAKNKAASGAGLSTYVCQSLSISNTSFDSNQAVAGVASIDTHSKGVPVFLTAVGDIAVAGRGAAIAASHVEMSLEGVLFSHNSADVSGGAVLLQQSHLRAANCTWSHNRALGGAGGGMLMEAGSGMELLQTTLISNTATSGGAAMILLPAEATMTVVMNDTVLEGNTAVEGTGGAVSATGRITFLTSRCNFSNNVASSSGGGLFCQNCMLLRLTGSTAAGNAAAGSGGMLCCLSCAQLEAQDVSAHGNMALEGGSITVSGLTRTSSIISSRFFNNTATADQDLLPALLRLPGLSRDSRTGSSWTSTCLAAPGAGGAICLHHCAAVTVSDSKFTNNTAATGGALFQERCSSSQAASTASIRGTSRRSLHSTSPGSPAKGILDFQHSVFIDNEAVGGGGGAIFAADASLVLFDTAPPSALLVQQLASNNSAVGDAGYGNGLASGPSSPQGITSLPPLQVPLQRQMRPALDAADLLFVGDYSQAQCAAGYSGKLCGTCDRLGGFGRGPGGQCVMCPGSFWQSLLAWLSVRVLDILVVSCMVVVWCQAAPQIVQVAEQPGGRVWFRLTKASLWQLCIMSYLTWSQLLALVVNGSAAGWQLQPWARGLASALLLTPQSTWQWVGLDCLLTTVWARRVSLGLLRTFLEVCYPVFLAPAAMLVAAFLMSRLKRRRRSPASSLVLLPPVPHQELDQDQLVVGGNHMSEAGSVSQPMSAAQAATAAPSAAAAGPAAPASEVSQSSSVDPGSTLQLWQLVF